MQEAQGTEAWRGSAGIQETSLSVLTGLFAAGRAYLSEATVCVTPERRLGPGAGSHIGTWVGVRR